MLGKCATAISVTLASCLRPISATNGAAPFERSEKSTGNTMCLKLGIASSFYISRIAISVLEWNAPPLRNADWGKWRSPLRFIICEGREDAHGRYLLLLKRCSNHLNERRPL